jgi:hypothetical protein
MHEKQAGQEQGQEWKAGDVEQGIHGDSPKAQGGTAESDSAVR